GLAMIAFSFAGTPGAAALLLSVTGFTLLLLTAAANTLLQTLAAEDKRGRVVSLYTMMVTGLAPVGGLLAGLLAVRAGAAPALRLAGGACVLAWLLVAVGFARRPLGAPAHSEAALGVVGDDALGVAVGLQPVEQALRLPRVQGAALAPT